jgi:hypothetical protein
MGEAILSTKRVNATSGTAHQINWLASAVAYMGGIAPAAKKLKVSERMVRTWLERGLAKATLDTVAAIGELGNVPMLCLIRAEMMCGAIRNADD